MGKIMGRISDARPSGTIQSKYDVPPPVATYASAPAQTPLISSSQIQHSSNRTGSAVVNRKPRRNGMQFFYSHGAVDMHSDGALQPGAAGVQSSRFQTQNVQLMDWQKNLAWFAAGYPRNLGLSTRVPQLSTKYTGGPTDAAMQQRPIFPKVQVVPRYSVRPATYKTKSSNG